MVSKTAPKIKSLRLLSLILKNLYSKYIESKIVLEYSKLSGFISNKLIVSTFYLLSLLVVLFLVTLNIAHTTYAQNFSQGFTQSTGKQTVNIHAYAPLLNNWAYTISSQGKIYTEQNVTIYMNEKVPVYIQTFGTDKVPLRDQTIFLSSPDTQYGLHITEPKIPTNVKGLTIGYITSNYSNPTTYTIIATDTTYAEAPVVFKNMLEIQYYPSKNYKPSIFTNITNFLGNLFSSTTNILNIISILLALIILIVMEKRLLISKISVTIQNQYRVLFGMIRILVIPYAVSIFALYNQHSLINYISLLILVLVSVHFSFVYVKNLKEAVSKV